MNTSLIEEANVHIYNAIHFGFQLPDEIFESISELFYNEKEFDHEWLKETIDKRYAHHQLESIKWTNPTDFERLAQAFDSLAKNHIVALHNAGYTRQDAEEECSLAISDLQALEAQPQGYCYYHAQDLERAIDPKSKYLYLGFGTLKNDPSKAQALANYIKSTLSDHGFEVEWSGDIEERLKIININWQKVADGQNWYIERVIELMPRNEQGDENDKSKPFWKIW